MRCHLSGFKSQKSNSKCAKTSVATLLKLFLIKVRSDPIDGNWTATVYVYYDKTWDGEKYVVNWYCASSSDTCTFTGGKIRVEWNRSMELLFDSATFYSDNLVVSFVNPTIRDSLWKTMMINLIYPIGSVYISYQSTSPKEVFGVGVWEQIIDKFLYCSNSSGTTGSITMTDSGTSSISYTTVYAWKRIG